MKTTDKERRESWRSLVFFVILIAISNFLVIQMRRHNGDVKSNCEEALSGLSNADVVAVFKPYAMYDFDGPNGREHGYLKDVYGYSNWKDLCHSIDAKDLPEGYAAGMDAWADEYSKNPLVLEKRHK